MNIQLTLTTPAHVHTLALDFAPDSLPGPGILRMWLDAFNSTMPVNELQEKLQTGQPFAFGGGMMAWVQKEN